MASSATSPRAIPFATNGVALLHLNFLLTGIVMTFLGPMLPMLAARWSITDAVSGRLYLTQFISSMFGMLASAPTVQRRGYRFTFIVGLIAMASGMALLASGPFSRGIVAVAILGFGHGITTPAGNLRTADINPQRSASALNLINAVWGLGAMTPPLLLKLVSELHHPTWFLYGTSAALTVLLIGFALAKFVPDEHSEAGVSQRTTLRIFSILPVICALFFIYVGAETAFGGWVATHARRIGSGNGSWWEFAPFFFYGSMLVGRLTAPLALRHRREIRVAEIGLTVALLGAVSLVVAHSVPLVICGAILAGLGLASIFPISVSFFPAWFGESSRLASGPIFACGNMGGAVLPWLVGVVSTHSGSLRFALVVPLMSVVAMLSFYGVQDLRRKRVLVEVAPSSG